MFGKLLTRKRALYIDFDQIELTIYVTIITIERTVCGHQKQYDVVKNVPNF